MKRCGCHLALRDARLERDHPRARPPRRPLGEGEGHDDHRRRDGERHQPVDEEGQPVAQHPRGDVINPARRTSGRKSRVAKRETGVTNRARNKVAPTVVATLTRNGDPGAHRTARVPDAVGGGQDPHPDGGGDRRLGAPRRHRGRRLLRLPVRPRLRPRRPGGRPRVRVRGREGRRRPVQRARISPAPRSTISRRSRSPGFKIDNPNAVSSCGCGHSFQVADGEAPEGAAGAAAAARRGRRLQPGCD